MLRPESNQSGVANPVVVGITGASGAVLARDTVDELLRRDVATAVVCTNAARLVWQEELEVSFNEALSDWQEHPKFTYYPINALASSIASGTFPTRGMALVPASMNSIASVANGLSNNLLLRAADVCLKEQRRLVIVPRESPVHRIHLENMLKLSQMGAVILPPEPAFYLKPRSIDDIVRFVVGRIMVALNLDDALPGDLRYQEGAG